jgi:hypothetical protein
MTRSLRIIAAGSLIAGLAVGTVTTLGAGAAGAQEAPPTTVPADRVAKACARVPNLQQQIQSRIARIQGGPEVKGSLAWLAQARSRAETRGNAQMIERIDARIAVRTQLVQTLQQRQDKLAQVAARCAEAAA